MSDSSFSNYTKVLHCERTAGEISGGRWVLSHSAKPNFRPSFAKRLYAKTVDRLVARPHLAKVVVRLLQRQQGLRFVLMATAKELKRIELQDSPQDKWGQVMRDTTKVNDVHPPVDPIIAKKSFHHGVGFITPAQRAAKTWPARHASVKQAMHDRP
ncbi:MULTISPECIES: hypothetical protein [Xanthomonas]|uniref:hypothetical protein n=1 Tax=Xanthomonas TaxID=338 RepID=UPI001C84B1F2|nr:MULTISPECIES: hypothetical protein [Xanthomonas]MCC5051258.1 hypothetical protein [Xanthomonas campestris pv. aberrans]MEB1125954.1 hypothetical protein [Xanthomonas campestris pv. campestris]